MAPPIGGGLARPAVLVTAAVVELAWCAVAVVFARAGHPLPGGVSVPVDVALVAVDLAGALALRAGRSSFTAEEHDAALVDAEAPFDEGAEEIGVLPVAERFAAAASALGTLERHDPDLARSVRLVRVGARVEVLFADEIVEPPPGFVLDERASLVLVGAIDDAVVDDEEPSDALVELGSEPDGTYFAPMSAVFPGTPEGEENAAEETVPCPAIVVASTGGPEVVVEPFGLRLLPPVESEAAIDPEVPDTPVLGATGPEDDAATGDDNEVALGLDEDDQVADDEDHRDAAMVVPEAPPENDAPVVLEHGEWLVPPGRVEVRILREKPDLTGELLAPPSAPAVEFVAYLAIHGHRASTMRLRDCLGTVRSLASRSTKTVWSAASDARRALGEELVPASSGTQPYELATQVTSDWGRFQALCALARENRDTAEARRALLQACSLVQGVPALSSRRFRWLDEEGLLQEMANTIADAAVRLAELELEALADGEGSVETVRLAVATGRILRPDAPGLTDAEKRLGLVRR